MLGKGWPARGFGYRLSRPAWAGYKPPTKGSTSTSNMRAVHLERECDQAKRGRD